MKKVILISKVRHRGAIRIKLVFQYDEELISQVRKLDGVRWSDTMKCWHIPFRREYLNYLVRNLTTNVSLVEKNIKAGTVKVQKETPAKQKPNDKKLTPSVTKVTGNQEKLQKYFRFLEGRRYSRSTVDTYCYFASDFLDFLKGKPLKDIDNRDIEFFIEEVIVPRNYSIASHRQFISSMKHFAECFPETGINHIELPLPKKSRKLPEVLSKDEVIAIIQATKNLKHRAIITLLYSAGLRIGELLNLRLSDIDLERKQIFIRDSKGRKDRYVFLAESFIPLLSNYLSTYRPSLWFVEGTKKKQYSPSSIRSFLKESCKLAGITKRVTPHTFRHSFATHLLEDGVDIRYIQELLGHNKPETTMIYTHITKRQLMNIRSPLDTIALKMEHQVDKGFPSKGDKFPRLSG